MSGPFMAVLPLAVRDNYAGGALELSYVNLAFWAATIVASIALVGLARRLTLRGRLIGVAVSVGALILMALSHPAAVPGVRGAELRLGHRRRHHA